MESDNKQRVPDIDLRFVSVTLFIATVLGYFIPMFELTG